MTFASTFLLVLGTAVSSVDTSTAVTGSLILGLVSVALRAGFKAAIEVLIAHYTKKS